MVPRSCLASVRVGGRCGVWSVRWSLFVSFCLVWGGVCLSRSVPWFPRGSVGGSGAASAPPRAPSSPLAAGACSRRGASRAPPSASMWLVCGAAAASSRRPCARRPARPCPPQCLAAAFGVPPRPSVAPWRRRWRGVTAFAFGRRLRPAAALAGAPSHPPRGGAPRLLPRALPPLRPIVAPPFPLPGASRGAPRPPLPRACCFPWRLRARSYFGIVSRSWSVGGYAVRRAPVPLGRFRDGSWGF